MSTAIASDLTIAIADYGDEADCAAIVSLLDAYARDPMGGGAPLLESTRAALCDGLSRQAGAFSLIARLDGEAVGLANCFTGYSTFKAMPLVNIHDFAVVPGHRGKGIGRALMRAIETEANKRGACKITLEVLSGNEPAKALYAAEGFGGYALDPAMGHAQFWDKTL